MTGRLRYDSGLGADGSVERSVGLDNRESALSGWAAALRGGGWDYELGARSVKSAVRKAGAKEVDTWFPAGAAAGAMSVFDADVGAGQPGALVLDGEWRQRALVLADEVEGAYADGSVTLRLTWALLDGFWTRSTSFPVSRAPGAAAAYLDYPFDAPYDLGAPQSDGTIVVPSGGIRVSCPLTITFYGPCEDPRADIAGNAYEVRASVPDGGRLVLDGPSLSAKVYVGGELYADVTGNAVRGDGEGRGSYAFQRVELGGRNWSGDRMAVRLSNCERATVTVHEMRGEPPWR